MPSYLVRPNGGDRHLVPTGQPLVVGRGGGSEVDLRIDDERVSRVHLSVQEIDGHIVVSDLGSSNGTIVNGVAIEGSVTALPGSVIEFGGVALRLIADESPSTDVTVRAADDDTEADQAGPAAGSDQDTDDVATQFAHPIFQTIVEEAVHAAEAQSGWLLAAEGRHLKVLAVGGTGTARVGQSVTIDGVRGLALAMGQASAQQPSPGDRSNDGAGGAAGVPTSVLACPCGDDDTVGVLEIAGRTGGGQFTLEDIELVSSLAAIAGTAIVEIEDDTSELTSPAQLSVELTALAESDPKLYRDVVRIMRALAGQR
jgi:pSer/pThr/pTyr-binding forkhead associated (FHA) protein